MRLCSGSSWDCPDVLWMQGVDECGEQYGSDGSPLDMRKVVSQFELVAVLVQEVGEAELMCGLAETGHGYLAFVHEVAKEVEVEFVQGS